ncbi:MAG: phosphatidate cytidylyltransferase [Pseudomonadota bacterium]
MLKKRLTSALIAIGLVAPLIIFLGPYAIYLFTMIIAAGCLYEYFTMIMRKDYSQDIRLFGIFVGVMILFFGIFLRRMYMGAVAGAIMFYCVYFLLRAKDFTSDVAPANGNHVGKSLMDLALSIFGILFFSVMLGYIPLLRDSYEGLKWIVVLMAVVWLGDTGAFFMGGKYGKTKLYPQISPNKTVEGALGGMLFSTVAVVICKLIFFSSLDFVDCVNIGVIGGVFGQTGDLIESMIKRSVDVKDSGAVMPGHGGFFDRFDGIIFAAPFFYLYVKFFF